MKKWYSVAIISTIALILWTATAFMFAGAFTGSRGASYLRGNDVSRFSAEIRNGIEKYAKQDPEDNFLSGEENYVHGGDKASGELDAASEEKIRCRRLPVLMYHSILKSRKGTYIVSPTQLEQDLTALEKEGYVTVFPSEVAAYSRGEYELPDKPLLITFDDGLYNNMYYGLEILKNHKAKALLNVVGKFSDDSIKRGEVGNPNFAYLSWEQMTELADSGCFEIGNHSYNMHVYAPRFGMGKLSGESEENYRAAIRSDVTKNQNKIDQCLSKCKLNPDVFSSLTHVYANGVRLPRVKALAFPFGKYTTVAIEELCSLGYEVLLSCNEGVNYVHFGGGSLQMLRRINRNGAYSTQEVLDKVNAEYKNNLN